MKIEHVRVDAFGRLSGFDTGSRSLGSLVVVEGPNEAGKSTLFDFLRTALYGFHPASRDRNPHLPWGAEEASGQIGVKLADGGRVTVERRLRSSPSARLVRGDTAEDLRNQPLPWVQHVPRTVFGQVFAITLADLAGLDEETWDRIQDRVVGSMGAADLRPARTVADGLEREAGEIWRPNRRGNQRLRDVQDEIRALRGRRGEALQRDRRFRSLVQEREDMELRLRDVREDRQRDRIVVERMQELLPVKRRLDHMTTLRSEGGPRSDLDGLPEDPGATLEALADERRSAATELSELDREAADLRVATDRFDVEARALLDHREDIARFVRAAANAGSDRAEAGRLDSAAAETEAKLRSSADALLSAPLERQHEDALARLSIELLGDRVERLTRARAEQARPGEERPADLGLRARTAVGAAMAIGGVLLLGWTWSGGPQVMAVVGAGLLAAGATLALVSRRPAPPQNAAESEVDEVSVLGSEVEAMLHPLPVRPEFLDPPGPPLVVAVTRLHDLVRDRRQAKRSLHALDDRLEALDHRAALLAEDLERASPATAEDLAARLEQGVRDAERNRNASESAARELQRLDRRRTVLRERLDATARQLSQLQARVEALGGIEEVARRIGAHRRADRIEEELERTHPDLAEIEARIREGQRDGSSWVLDEMDLAERKARMEELDERVEELIASSQALERDAEHLRQQETVDAVDSEIATLAETESRLIRQRDRKWVLAQLVREADRRFREEHQPDLLRRASAYLSRLTGGRYSRLIVDEHGDGDLFQLVGPGLPAPVPLARPISTGTLEQAYLSLRLAIVDHLDQGRERLPLFIDEAFVNWDAQRRDRGLEVLAEVSEVRQVFAFTCHPDMAARLGALGACVLRLER